MPRVEVQIGYSELRALIAGDVPPDAEIVTLRIDAEHQLVYVQLDRPELPAGLVVGSPFPLHPGR